MDGGSSLCDSTGHSESGGHRSLLDKPAVPPDGTEGRDHRALLYKPAANPKAHFVAERSGSELLTRKQSDYEMFDRSRMGFRRIGGLNRVMVLALLVVGVPTTTSLKLTAQEEGADAKPIRVGIIGLDTSHAPAFAKLLNDENASPELANCRVVVAYPHGSADIESSVSRIPRYTEEVGGLGVEIVDSIDALIEQVDCVLLETNDGRPHLEQVFPVLRAGKPVFIDKPITASLEDAYAIFMLAKHFDTPVFSSSSLRFSEGVQAVRNGSVGRVTGCDSYSPCSLEATHPDLFWYGIHGVELLFTAMGAGCQSVVRTQTEGTDIVVGTWEDGRVGTFRGIRNGKSGYGGTAYGTDGISTLGKFDGYRPLVVEIVKFFRTGQVPVEPEETLDLYAFMAAADVSKEKGGVLVSIEAVKAEAMAQAEAKIAKMLAASQQN